MLVSTRKMNIDDMQIKPWTTYEHRVMSPTKNDRNVYKLVSTLCKNICIAIKHFFNWKLRNSSSFLFLTKEEYLSENVFSKWAKVFKNIWERSGREACKPIVLNCSKISSIYKSLCPDVVFSGNLARQKKPFFQN